MSEPRTGPVGVGIIGAGVISRTYLENLTSFPDIVVHAVGDLFPEAAATRAAEFGIPVSGDVDTVLNHPDVEIVVNLTIPAAHAQVASAAIAAGKHAWNEKPLALNRDEARTLLEQADAAGLRVGCAPDTFLGSGLQTARALVDSGRIGTPLTALVLLQGPGADRWHPNPAFLFQEGGGPVLDMGPYYLTALVQTFGPIASVSATGVISRATRTIVSGPRAGEEFDVTVPTHVSATASFESGGIATLVFSSESALSRAVLEVNGSEATMIFPDPNRFDGEITVQAPGGEPEVVAETTERSSRGTGVLDLARAVREGRPHRAQSALAYHVLDTMLSINDSMAAGGVPVEVASSVERSEPLPEDWDPKAKTV